MEIWSVLLKKEILIEIFLVNTTAVLVNTTVVFTISKYYY